MMYSYPRFAPPSQRAVVELVRTNPFALLVSAEAGAAPVATHLPMLLPENVDPDASLEGALMRGHLGRKNPHWHQFTGPTPVLLVFSTSHGYVSPRLYDADPAAPTLDYAAVHLTGELELADDEKSRLAIVEATVEALESQQPQRWDPSASRDYFRRILPGVVSFTVRVTGQDAMFKLSQDQSPATRQRVRDEFAGPVNPHPQLSTLMHDLEDESR